MSEYVWLIIIPETYDDLVIDSPAQSYVLTEEPSDERLAQVLDSGGHVYVIPRPDGDFDDITITVNDDDVPNTDDGFDLSYDDESDIEIEIESDDAVLTFDHEYQNKLIVFGYAEEGEPFYAADYSVGTVYRIDSGTGETIWSLNSPDFQDMNLTTKNLFPSSDGSYCFVIKAGMGGISPPGSTIKIYLIDSSGTPTVVDSTDVYDGLSYIGIVAAGFDPIEEKLYVYYNVEPSEEDEHCYLKIYSKTGSLISNTDTGLEEFFIFIGAYNGNILLATLDNIITWNDAVITGLTIGGNVLDYGFDSQGYLYLYYETTGFNPALSKIKNGVVVWTRNFGEADGDSGTGGLSVNKYGDCTCKYTVDAGSGRTAKVNTNNNLIWTREISVSSIDNNGNLYT